jgi:hypothetical protein
MVTCVFLSGFNEEQSMKTEIRTEITDNRQEITAHPEEHHDDTNIGVLIISGSCCFPNMAPLDELAQRVTDQAVAKAGVKAHVRTITATSAYYGGVPKETINRIMMGNNTPGTMPFPVILVNGEVVSYGVPEPDELVRALRQKQEEKNRPVGTR